MADCPCVDSVTNVYRIPCIHSIVLIMYLKLKWSFFDFPVRRNIINSLLKTSADDWSILGSPKGSEDRLTEKFWEHTGVLMSGDVQELRSDANESKE